jgi:hypothetical protein
MKPLELKNLASLLAGRGSTASKRAQIGKLIESYTAQVVRIALPPNSPPNKYAHLALVNRDRQTCTCINYLHNRRGCKHILAVEAFVANSEGKLQGNPDMLAAD